jgi:hypothetical protein
MTHLRTQMRQIARRIDTRDGEASNAVMGNDNTLWSVIIVTEGVEIPATL